MNNLKLVIPIDDFVKKINSVLFKDEIEFNTKIIESEEDLRLLDNEIKMWEFDILSTMDKSFSGGKEYFIQKMYRKDYSIINRTDFFNKKTIADKKDILIQDYIKNKNFIFDFSIVIPVLDKVNCKKNIFLFKYEKPSEIIYLILSKLRDLKDGNFFRIDIILEGNGIELKNGIQEFFEYTNVLEKNGWVDFDDKFSGKITLKGEIFLEKQNKMFLKMESDMVSKRIDLIIAKLEKLGFGQEILFEELEELKSLYSKLNKKNWAQVLKGKIVDLVLDKIIDTSAAKIISDDLLENDFSKFFPLTSD